MTWFRFNAAIAGWNRVHGSHGKVEPPTDEEFDEMVEAHRELGLLH